LESKLKDAVKNTTCFSEHEKRGLSCGKRECRQWMGASEYLNCAVIAANQNDDGMTLQQIGDIFDITRMRVCQLEKASLQKISVE
jgi:hypothetical protein